MPAMPTKPARRLTTEELRDRKPDRETFLARPRTPIAIVLDSVHGPYNQGALFRLADAFALERLHFCGDDPLRVWNRRFKKAARGTTAWVPYSSGEVSVDVVASYRERGYQVVAAEQAEGSVSMASAELMAPMCLVLGAEMHGVSREVLELCDVVVEFPMLGMANSLNIAMSAAMLVQAAFQTVALGGPPVG